MSAALPIFAPDGVERALLANAGTSIPVAQSIAATRPPKFTVPIPSDASPFTAIPGSYDLVDNLGIFTNGPLPSGITGIIFNAAAPLAGFNISPGTDASTLTLLSWPNLVTIDNGDTQGGYFAVGSSESITTISAPLLQSVAGIITVDGNVSLVSVDFSSLIASEGFFVQSNPALPSLTIPALATVGDGGIEINSNASATAVSFPSLTASIGLVNIASNNALTSVAFPVLTTCGGLTFNDDTALTSVSLPILAHLTGASNGLTIASTNVTSISLPDFIDTIASSGIAISNNPALTIVSLPNYIPATGTADDFSNNALSVATVNSILATYVANGLTAAGVLSVGGQTPAAPPSGAGVTNAALLVTNGWTVTTD